MKAYVKVRWLQYMILFLVGLLPLFCADAMDIVVYEGELQKVVQGIARSGNLNIVGADGLKGTVTVSLHDMTPLEALREISKVANFTVQDTEQCIYISSNEATHMTREVLILQPRYIKATALAETLQAIAKSEHIKVRPEGTEVILYGTLGERLAAQKLLKQLDYAPRQVRITAHVLAIQHSTLKELGLSWQWSPLTNQLADRTGQYGSIKWGQANNGGIYEFLFKANLEALETKGKAVLLACPSMAALHGEEAQILIGDRIPVVTENVNGNNISSSIHYEQAGIRLTYTPYIEPSGYIDAVVRAEVSNPTLVPELKAYRITTREAKTRVRLQDGEIFVIGGLMDNRQMNSKSKVPLLGDIPLLGKLFQQKHEEQQKVELLIFLQAHIQSDTDGKNSS